MRQSKGLLGPDAMLTLAVVPAIAAGNSAPAKATQYFTCRGANGSSKAPDTPNLVGQNEQYLIKALQDFHPGARAHEVMSMMAKGLSDQDIQVVSAYFSAIATSVKAPQFCRQTSGLGATFAGQAFQAGIARDALSGFAVALMRIIVLGTPAGGGFPQWNCNCRNCVGYRVGTIRALAHTQSSIAVSTNGLDWPLVNAPPDILTQIRVTSALQPGQATCDTGTAVVLLMDAQVDHIIGLMMLYESGRLRVYCVASARGDLTKRLPLTWVLMYCCGTD